jgi:hypothetical protein
MKPMSTIILNTCLVSVCLLGCVSTSAPAGVDEPSSPEAETAPPPLSKNVLEADESTPVSQASAALHTGDGHTTEPPNAVEAHVHGATAADPHADHDHGSNPQTEANEQHKVALYTCPMHPEVQQKQPGRCPKCGMNLEPAKSESK